MNRNTMWSLRSALGSERIDPRSIGYSERYCLMPDVLAASGGGFPPLFIRRGKRYYPVFMSKAATLAIAADRSPVHGIVTARPVDALNLFCAFRAPENCNLAEKLYMLRFCRNNRIVRSDFENLSKYLPILALPSSLISPIAAGRLSPELALRMTSRTDADCRFFAELIHAFGLGQNHQKEVFAWLCDNARITGNSFSALLDINRFASCGDGKRKTVCLIEFIRNRTMPDFQDTARRFERIKKGLSLPAGVNVIEPAFFETKDMKIELHFRTINELFTAVSGVAESLDKKKSAWQELFSIL